MFEYHAGSADHSRRIYSAFRLDDVIEEMIDQLFSRGTASAENFILDIATGNIVAHVRSIGLADIIVNVGGSDRVYSLGSYRARYSARI